MEGMAAAAAPVGDFFARSRARLSLTVPKGLDDPAAATVRGDLDLDPALWERAEIKSMRPASVLVGVVDRTEPTVLLTMRTADLPNHAGQIAFPGGKIEPEDETPLAAAAREAHEEIGLDRSLIDPIGYLDLYLTLSGFRILPAVARIAPDYHLSLNTSEVSDAFEVPLDFLMTPANHQQLSRDWRGMTRHYFAMPYQDRYIWGVTAGILRNLYERIYGR